MAINPREPKVVAPDRVVSPEALKPGFNWSRQIPAPGHSGVDFEERVNFRRLHDYRLNRARQALAKSNLGSILCFDNNNIRYLTSTVIGEWSRDKMCRFALLTGNGDPFLWDFGSAALHHRLYAPWLPRQHCLAGMVGLRGSVAPEAGLFKRAAEEIKAILKEQGVAKMPIGLDIAELPMIFALREAGLEVMDGQQTMLDARQIKNVDEIMLLNMSAAMVDGVYQVIAEHLKPGVRECDIVALANKTLYEMGSDDVEGINAIAGERCSPHPHNFTDRIIRPGDQAFFDIIQCARVDGCIAQPGKAGRHYRPDRRLLAEGRGIRICERDGGLRAPVRARPWPRAPRTTDHQSAGLVRPADGNSGRDGLCAGDLLPGERWSFCGADRGRSGGHRCGLSGDHPLPSRGAFHRQPLLTGRARPSRRME